MEQRKPAKSRIPPLLPPLILTVLGAAGGYLYYRLVGCASGACPITSNPYLSAAYGGVIGLLLGSSLTPGRKIRTDDKTEDL